MHIRFSLRTLFIAVTVVAVATAVVGAYRSHSASRPDHTIVTLNGDASMEPYIASRAYFVADLNAYRASKPRRWDAVVFDHTPPATASALWVAALPGETVSILNGRLFVDGVEIKVPISVFRDAPVQIRLPGGSTITHPYVVPKQSYYLLGGNLAAANDSRSFGAVAAARIAGRVHR